MDDRRQAEPEPLDGNQPNASPDDPPETSVPVERSTDVKESEAHPS